MKQILRIQVDVPHQSNTGKFVTLLRNQIELDDSLDYDYKGLLRGLKLLYPNKQLIINLSIL